MLNQTNQTSKFSTNIRETDDYIPSEENVLHRDTRLSAERRSLENFERETPFHPVEKRTGLERPLGNPTLPLDNRNITNVGYTSTPIGHGTHPQITPSSPVKEKELRAALDNLGLAAPTSGFTTHTGTTMTHQTHNIQATSTVPIAGTIPITTSEIRTVQRPIEHIGGPEVSEIRPDEHNLSRQIDATEQSRWEAQHADVSSMRYENHQAFENWEVNRNTFVTDRINIMDDLIAGMDKKLAWLETGVQKVILFFKEREHQEERYSKVGRTSMPQLGEHFEKADDPVLFNTFSKGMKESDAFHAQDRRNSEIMGNFIKKDIIDWILIPSENNYKLQSKALKNPMRDFRRRLDMVAKNRDRSYQKYFKSYDHLQKSSKLTPEENKIFKNQLKYSLSSREELRLLKLYNEHGLMVINEYTRLATTRMNEIQRAFSLYLQKYLELYTNSAPTPEPILDLIESSNGAEAIQHMFLPKNLLTYNNYEFLRRQLNLEEISYADIEAFLVNFPESIDPARTALITREFDAVKVGGFFHRTRPCTILATNSNNLLIIEKKFEDSQDGKVKDPFQLRFTTVDKVYASNHGTGTIVSVIERTPGNVFHHNAKAKLKFETAEEAQAFLDFLQSKNGMTFDHNTSMAGNFVTSQYVGTGVHNLSGVQGIVQDPMSRTLGSQVQAGQIISSHVIGSRPVLQQPQTVLTSQPITHTVISQPVIREQVHITQPTQVIREQVHVTQPVQQIVREATFSQIQPTTSNVRNVTQQMTDI